MTLAVDAAIQAALYARLKALQLPTALPIAPEGRNFDSKGKAYLRPTYLPAETLGLGVESDGDAIHSGLYQIDVMWPVDKGVSDAMTVAGAVAVQFGRGLRLVTGDLLVQVDQPPSLLPAMQEPDRLQVPVRVRWVAYVSGQVAA